MSRPGPLSTVVTAVLGATLGGLLLWRVVRYRMQRKSLPSAQKADAPAEWASSSSPAPVEKAPERPPADAAASPAAARSRIPPPEELLEAQPVLVSSEEEWERLWPSLQKELSLYPVLGFDCEWVSTKGRTSSVSLLQMASYSGLCVLVRLVQFGADEQRFPLSLMEVLRDPRVLKVGVGCYEDGKRLTRDHGLPLGCTVDLRYLALRQRQVLSNGLSLKSLAADMLNVSLDKSLELRCSDWEAEQLSAEQMSYAARDAQVSIALFFHLLGLHSSAAGPAASYAQLAAPCQGLVDVPFKSRGGREGGGGAAAAGGGRREGEERRRRQRKPSCENPESGDQEVPDPRRNNRRKPLGVGYSARKSPLYDNCYLHAPDGQPLCTCDKKKAKWYLDKGIGELQSEEPFIVRLLFEPSGRPDSQQDYYLTAKENLCVVCGKEYSYIRKNIVPHEYRRHFPAEMKDHNSHDILLLCTACHAASNVHDCSLKQQLSEEFGAPQGCEEGVRLLEDSERRRVRSAARALLSAGDALPEQRRHELRGLVRSFLDQDLDQHLEISTEMLQEAAGLETRICNEAYTPHGLKVVRAHAERGLRGLIELERRWRQHFLSSMQPGHLPPLWAVDHNHKKFLLKYGTDLPIKLN